MQDKVNEVGEKLLKMSQQITQNKYAELNKSATNVEGVIIGDSIVEGFPIWEMLPDSHIYNRGINGDTTEGLFTRLSDTVLAISPKKVYIWIGTNDIGRLVPTEEIICNLNKTFANIRERLPDVKLFLLSVCPVNRNYDPIKMVWGRTNEQIKALNVEYKKLCNEHYVEFLDFYDKLTDENGDLNLQYTVDGLHLNILGYRAVIDTIKNKL